MTISLIKRISSFVLILAINSMAIGQDLPVKSGTYRFKIPGETKYFTLEDKPILAKKIEPVFGWTLKVKENNTFTIDITNDFLGIEIYKDNFHIKGFDFNSENSLLWRMVKSSNDKICLQDVKSGIFLKNGKYGITGTKVLSEAMEIEVLKRGGGLQKQKEKADKWTYIHLNNSLKLSASEGIVDGDIVESNPNDLGDENLWKFVVVENGFRIQNKKTGLFLTSNGETSPGSRVRLTDAPNENAVWELTFSDYIGYIKNKHSGNYLGIRKTSVIQKSNKSARIEIIMPDTDVTDQIVN
jgi:hypothetical protein